MTRLATRFSFRLAMMRSGPGLRLDTDRKESGAGDWLVRRHGLEVLRLEWILWGCLPCLDFLDCGLVWGCESWAVLDG